MESLPVSPLNFCVKTGTVSGFQGFGMLTFLIKCGTTAKSKPFRVSQTF